MCASDWQLLHLGESHGRARRSQALFARQLLCADDLTGELPGAAPAHGNEDGRPDPAQKVLQIANQEDFKRTLEFLEIIMAKSRIFMAKAL